MKHLIEIKGLSLLVFLGVPEEERQQSQEIQCDVRFRSAQRPPQLCDDIINTIDYAAVYRRIQEIAEERPRHLLETLADEIADLLYQEFQLSWIEVQLFKHILPRTDYVSVTVERGSKIRAEKAKSA